MICLIDSKINSISNEKLKAMYLKEEISYVSNRLKVQKVIGGWWFDGAKFVRRLSLDENKAYYSLHIIH